jgi:ABC-type Mn2+/Zn2+ transport system ATPase subunit
VLVLDEPTFGQDAATWRELVTLLAEQRAAGCALALVTHDADLVEILADERLSLARATGERASQRDARSRRGVSIAASPGERGAERPGRRPQASSEERNETGIEPGSL